MSKSLRIRYKKMKKREDWVESVQIFQSTFTGAKYKARINHTTKDWEIHNVGQGRNIKKGNGPQSKEGLQQKVKRELKDLGVSFELELRRT